jgi:hypothetical protein
MAGFRNKPPEEGYWKFFLDFVSDFIEASRTLFWIFLTKGQSKVMKFGEN